MVRLGFFWCVFYDCDLRRDDSLGCVINKLLRFVKVIVVRWGLRMDIRGGIG